VDETAICVVDEHGSVLMERAVITEPEAIAAALQPFLTTLRRVGQGRISKAGDPDVRRALYEAASAMLTRFKGKTALKTWGMKIAKRCHQKAVVAVARKLAVVMHAMWRHGTEYTDRPANGSAGDAPSVKDRKLLGVYA